MTTRSATSESLALPLQPEARDAYEDLYKTLKNEIDDSADPIALKTLNDPFTSVNNVLVKDDMCRLHANTALFQALLLQIRDTNIDLDKLRGRIKEVAAHFKTAADILAAITKVITIMPGV